MNLVNKLYASLVALTIGTGCATGSVASKADDRLNQLKNMYECVAVGKSSFKDTIVAIKDAEHRARVNYVKKCLGQNTASVGIGTANPVTTEMLNGHTAVAYKR